MANGKQYALQIAIGGMIASSLKKATGQATKELSGLQKLGAGIGKGLAAGFGVAVTAVAAVGKELYDIGAKFDEANDKIRIGTGATGEDLEALSQSMKNVYGAVPNELGDVSTAIADYNTRLGVTGTTLESLSTQALQASEMLGEDLGGMIESSSQAFQQWGVSEDEMAEKMDYMFKVSQSTGTGMTTLFGEMQSYGAQLQNMGYSFEEAAALMGQMDKAGVNTTEVLSAMKKSVTTLAKKGISASKGFEMYAKQIKNAKTEAEAAAIASEVFGARAGSTMASAIRNGTMSVDDFTAALEANNETIGSAAWDTYDFPEQMEMMKHNLETALEPAGSILFSSLSGMMPDISKLLTSVLPLITTAVEQLVPIITTIFSAIDFEMLGRIITTLVEALAPFITEIAGYLPEIVGFVMQIFQALSPLLGPLLSAISSVVQVVMQLVTSLLPVILPLLEPIVQLLNLLLPIINAISAVISFLVPIIATIVNFISTGLSVALQFVIGIIQSLMVVLQGIIDFLVNVFQGNWQGAWESIKGIFTGIWDVIKSTAVGVINSIIRFINGFINGINKIHIAIPNWSILGDMAGKEFGPHIEPIPEVALAQGGIVTQPTNALIGEAGESEAVIPLSKLDSMLGGGTGGGDIYVTFSPTINCGSGNPAEISEVMEDEFEKFKDYMERYLRSERRLQFSH